MMRGDACQFHKQQPQQLWLRACQRKNSVKRTPASPARNGRHEFERSGYTASILYTTHPTHAATEHGFHRKSSAQHQHSPSAAALPLLDAYALDRRYSSAAESASAATNGSTSTAGCLPTALPGAELSAYAARRQLRARRTQERK